MEAEKNRNNHRGEPRLVPDGKKIIFVRNNYNSDQNQHSDAIYVANTDGSGEVKLRAFDNNEFHNLGGVYRLSWR